MRRETTVPGVAARRPRFRRPQRNSAAKLAFGFISGTLYCKVKAGRPMRSLDVTIP
jgi:hypothetical protein